MKAIPLHQPFAGLVTAGVKTTETRDRHTKHRGALGIYVTRTRVEYADAPAAWDALADVIGVGAPWRITDEMLHRGKLLGVVDVRHSAACMDLGWDGSDDLSKPGWLLNPPYARVHPDQRQFGDFGPGRRAWLLADAFELRQPIVCRPMPGMWTLPSDVVHEVAVQLSDDARLDLLAAVRAGA